ncbi:hypothetical protein ACFQY0_09770 [Haloferula chungangensis]|uniref:Transcriptional regulator n=1 Tax=Haloferula chungangensis TaxID=1048331 RepID=A0ABW2L579_9BACT
MNMPTRHLRLDIHEFEQALDLMPSIDSEFADESCIFFLNLTTGKVIETMDDDEICGKRKYLCDDLANVDLDPSLIAEPPLTLWPKIVARTELPDDVRNFLKEGLR